MGTGLPRVVLTDRDAELAFNMQVSLDEWCPSALARKNAVVYEVFDWSGEATECVSKLTEKHGIFDLVLLADCVCTEIYDSEGLVQTLKALLFKSLRGQFPRALLSIQRRRSDGVDT